VKGAEEWNGKFTEFIKTTTYDPALGGYPPPTASSSTGAVRDTTLDTNTAFDNLTRNPLTYDNFVDVHSSEEPGITGALGGGGDLDGVE